MNKKMSMTNSGLIDKFRKLNIENSQTKNTFEKEYDCTLDRKGKEYFNKELIIKTRNGDINGIVKCINNGANIHTNNDTVLYEAVVNEKYNIIDYLFTLEPQSKFNCNKAFIYSAKNGYLEIFNLLRHGGESLAKLNNHTFYDYTTKSKREIIMILLVNKINIQTNIYFIYRHCLFHIDRNSTTYNIILLNKALSVLSRRIKKHNIYYDYDEKYMLNRTEYTNYY